MVNNIAQLINDQIPNKDILVIDSDGNKLGNFSKIAALTVAKAKGFDLVMVSETDTMVTAKLLNYSKHVYEQEIRNKQNKKSQVKIKLKEVQLSPNIGEHDFQTKLKQAKKFAEKGDKIKISLLFRGRMITHQDIGFAVVNRFIEELSDLVDVTSKPKLDGKTLIALLDPIKKK
jgi:translation initiation factor IF-3